MTIDGSNCRSNLDAFRLGGSDYADPITETGPIWNVSEEFLRKNSAASKDKLAQIIPPENIYCLQMSDAYKTSLALKGDMVVGLEPHNHWHRAYRPMPGSGGYLPIEDVVSTMLNAGFGDSAPWRTSMLDRKGRG